MLRFEIPGTITVAANNGDVVLTQGLTIEMLARYSNTTPDQWEITQDGEIKFKPTDRYQKINIDIRLAGTITGAGPGGTGEFIKVIMERKTATSPNTHVTASSCGIMNVGTLDNKKINFDSYTDVIDDPYIVNGVRFRMTNVGPGAITITSRVILIQCQKF